MLPMHGLCAFQEESPAAAAAAEGSEGEKAHEVVAELPVCRPADVPSAALRADTTFPAMGVRMCSRAYCFANDSEKS
jgi:hypothetical protein